MQAVSNETRNSERTLIRLVRSGDKDAFEQIFFRYHSQLCGIAAKITGSSDRARDVVQEVFMRIWRTRSSWQVDTSLRAYLYGAVWNEALNEKDKKQNRRKLYSDFSYTVDSPKTFSSSLNDTTKTVKRIWEVVETMSRRRKFVFTLHRKHGLSYKEIAKVMEISRKTVENHMGLALKEIRDSIC